MIPFPRFDVDSDGQDDIVVFDPDLVALGHIGTLYQFITAFDRDIKLAYFEPVRSTIGLPRPDLEFPAVEWTSDEFALACDRVFSDPLRLHKPDHRTPAEFRTTMRTPVEQREKLAIDVEDADLTTGRLDNLV